MSTFLWDQTGFKNKEIDGIPKSLAKCTNGHKSFPLATSLKIYFVISELDFIRSSSDLALAMQKCAYKWKVK